jgi:predicted DNA-binding protein
MVERVSNARLPVAGRRGRRRKDRDQLLTVVSTNLPPEEVAALDALAGAAGETRSEYIRRAVLARMNASTSRGLEDIMREDFGPA